MSSGRDEIASSLRSSLLRRACAMTSALFIIANGHEVPFYENPRKAGRSQRLQRRLRRLAMTQDTI
jgi:hypothetical protein